MWDWGFFRIKRAVMTEEAFYRVFNRKVFLMVAVVFINSGECFLIMNCFIMILWKFIYIYCNLFRITIHSDVGTAK